jgi:uncharacterized membrane protein
MIEPDNSHRRESARIALRWLMAVLYLIAGCMHLLSPGPFLAITPHWVPWPSAVILLTGLCEIAGAVALQTVRLRRFAGGMLAAYAVCVYPANVQHAINDLAAGGRHLGWWYHAPRLALQPVLVWWALFAGEVIDWPFQRSRFM